MCGICGFIGNNNMENKISVLENMMEKIKHRGPDESGSYLDDQAALGFLRLSIIDLDKGSQPMFNETKDISIIFNGEIYNYIDLKKKLKEKGHVFQNESDTECLIHEYEDYGAELLNHIRGMFAFAIWDSKKQTLFAARDFFGIKPFYYAIIQDYLVFASEIKSILEFPGYEKQVNQEALEQYLSFQYSVLPETFFKGIFRLEPGHYLTYHKGKLEIKQYWNPLLCPRETPSYEQLLFQVDHVTRESIKKHMMSDVEVGSLLSSGVDSSFVAAEFSGNRTFTVGFMEEDSPYNEIPYAKKLAGTIRKQNYNKTISPQEYWKVLPEVMYYMDEPLGDAAAVALYFVDKEAAKHVKVALSGEGIDELFAGYNIYLEPQALHGYQQLSKPIRMLIAKLIKKIPFDFKGKNFLIRGSKELEERYIGNANVFSMEERKRILKQPILDVSPTQLAQKYYNEIGQVDHVTKMQYVDLKFWLPGDILLKADKMSMAHSLEIRVPFLDKEVFQVACNMNSRYKIKKNTTKYIFRQVAGRYLPRETADKKKLGFPVPIRIWLRQEVYYQAVKDMFESETAATYFNTLQLIELLGQHKKGKKDNSRKIWVVYMFLIWHRVYFASM